MSNALVLGVADADGDVLEVTEDRDVRGGLGCRCHHGRVPRSRREGSPAAPSGASASGPASWARVWIFADDFRAGAGGCYARCVADPKITGEAPIAVIAMGGHAFMQAGEIGTYEDHAKNARHVSHQVIALLNRGYNLVITHGNGPQVGNLLNQVEAMRDRVPPLPLDALVAQTEGSLGYFLQQALLNELRSRSMRRFVVTMVTQVVVSRDDPGLKNPTKPIGPFLSQEDAEERRDRLGWDVREDAGRGWRRVVASPTPIKVIQRHMVRQAAQAGHIVVACGGGGIPVVKSENGDYVGIEAVIDKDLTSSVLATDIGADLFIILTAVDRVFLNYKKPDQTVLNAVTLSQCQRYMEEGHFPAGSMGPKVRAVYEFLKRGGRRALITSSEKLEEAMDGEAGTHFVGKI